MPRAAHTQVRMFGTIVFWVEADSRRKKKQTLSLLENKADVYIISPAYISWLSSIHIDRSLRAGRRRRYLFDVESRQFRDQVRRCA
jgi:hypothetical protein